MQQDNNQKTIIIATLSFILGFGLSWLISTNKTVAPGSEKTPDTASSEVQADVLMNTVVVKDQSEGVSVTLERVSFKDSGWAVIHEEDSATPGRILGAQLFDAGTWTQGKVELLRGTIAGKNYYAMLHTDNDDRAFNPKNDLPIPDDEGNPIMIKFTATASNASE
ncbi:MAG TPA: hypothetical protein VJH94_03145 [Candidatus Paceibacterota bacterium]